MAGMRICDTRDEIRMQLGVMRRLLKHQMMWPSHVVRTHVGK